MNCSRIREILNDYVDGLLDDDARSSVEHHLARCPECAEECDGLRRVIDGVRGLPALKAPARFGRDLFDRIDGTSADPAGPVAPPRETGDGAVRPVLSGTSVLFRILPLAAAALFLITVTAIFVLSGDDAGTPGEVADFSGEEIARLAEKRLDDEDSLGEETPAGFRNEPARRGKPELDDSPVNAKGATEAGGESEEWRRQRGTQEDLEAGSEKLGIKEEREEIVGQGRKLSGSAGGRFVSSDKRTAEKKKAAAATGGATGVPKTALKRERGRSVPPASVAGAGPGGPPTPSKGAPGQLRKAFEPDGAARVFPDSDPGTGRSFDVLVVEMAADAPLHAADFARGVLRRAEGIPERNKGFLADEKRKDGADASGQVYRVDRSRYQEVLNALIEEEGAIAVHGCTCAPSPASTWEEIKGVLDGLTIAPDDERSGAGKDDPEAADPGVADTEKAETGKADSVPERVATSGEGVRTDVYFQELTKGMRLASSFLLWREETPVAERQARFAARPRNALPREEQSFGELLDRIAAVESSTARVQHRSADGKAQQKAPPAPLWIVVIRTPPGRTAEPAVPPAPEAKERGTPERGTPEQGKAEAGGGGE